MPVKVVTDSVASIPRARADALGLDIVTLYVNDGENHYADVDLDPDAFYRRLGDLAHLPTSSQPSVDALVGAFRDGVTRGCDVLGVFMSERMSGTVATARLAADLVRDEIPAARIEIVDSGSNSMQEGFASLAAAQAACDGRPLGACIEAATAAMRRSRFIFSPESLEYLRRGGRIGTASALLGGLLQIKPILTVNEGQTDVLARVRTHQRALTAMAETFSADVRRCGLSDAVVHYIGERVAGERFAAELVAPIAGRDVEAVPVSPVIGAHVGPALGIAYLTETPPA